MAKAKPFGLSVPTLGKAKPQRAGQVTAPAPTPAQLTAQSWLPVQDVRDGCLIRKDGGVVAGVQIAPFSLQLKSERERESAIRGFQAILSGISVPWELVSMYRATDLDSYLAGLKVMGDETSGPRRQVLTAYTQWVQGKIESGESVERRYYLLLTRTGKDAVAEHQQTLRGIVEDAQRIRGFRVDILTDERWRELLFLLFHAARSAVESVPEEGFRPTPLYRKETHHG